MFHCVVESTDSATLLPAIHALRSGAVVVLPTDTIYGLSARIDRPRALQRIREIKGRQEMAPFLVLIPRLEELAALTTRPPSQAVVDLLWPGPVTVLLPARDNLPAPLVGPQGTVAVRWPATPLVLAILEGLGLPIVSTSINRSGGPPLLEPAAIAREFGAAIDVLVDSGPTPDAVASTVIDLTRDPPVIVRQGGRRIDLGELEAAMEGDPTAP